MGGMSKSNSSFSYKLVRQSSRRGLKRIIIFSLVWFALTGADTASWLFGIPAVLMASYISLLVAPPAVLKISVAGAISFIPFFLLQSLYSGVDVMRRSTSPRLPINPGLMQYQTYLPEGAPRIFLVNTISLLPGTLSAEIQDNNVTVHIIDKDLPIWANIQNLEWRIAFLFKVTPFQKGEA
jgi:multicomponent Na+:H+ antiporter subunit E